MSKQDWAKKHRGVFHHALVYWGTTKFKDEYTPNKIVIKIFMMLGHFVALSKHRACQIQNFYISRVNVAKFLIHHLRNKFGTLPHVFNYHQMPLVDFRFSYNIFTFTLRINWSSRSPKMLWLFSIQLLFSAATWISSQSSKKMVFWCDVT